MLEFAKRPKDPGATQLQVPGIENIHGAGDFFTWLGESSGQMLGSMLAAAQTGGLAGAGAGAGIGGAGGAAVGPAGAAAGAVGGAITGFGYGSIASYGAMGVGGMFQDLMADADIQKALAAGQVTPTQILAWSTGAGAVIGALDAFPAFKAGHRVAGELAEGTLKQGFTKAILKGTLKGAGEEGITEGLQGAISELGQGILSGNPDLMKRGMSVLNQALVGAVGGGGPGVLGGISEERRAEPPPGQVNPAPAGGGGRAAAPVHPPQPQGPAAPALAPPRRPAPERRRPPSNMPPSQRSGPVVSVSSTMAASTRTCSLQLAAPTWSSTPRRKATSRPVTWRLRLCVAQRPLPRQARQHPPLPVRRRGPPASARRRPPALVTSASTRRLPNSRRRRPQHRLRRPLRLLRPPDRHRPSPRPRRRSGQRRPTRTCPARCRWAAGA